MTEDVVLSPLPISLSFRDLSYTVQNKKILKSVSGYVSKGSFLSIMGPSGAGKSSLLDVLSGRNPRSSELKGELLVDGKPRATAFKKRSGYVYQDDCLLENLTAREMIMYSFRLRVNMNEFDHAASKNPELENLKRKERIEAFVDNIILLLNLKKVRDTRIGSQVKRGISGGERKRVNIGTEMVTSPGILFIDEPTTGLDSTNALRVMKSIKNLCKNGTTIVCTIHQPRSNIFLLFDKLLLLYFGETVYYGNALKAMDYFGNLGIPCPTYLNPGDFLLDILDDEEFEKKTKKKTNKNKSKNKNKEVKIRIGLYEDQDEDDDEDDESITEFKFGEKSPLINAQKPSESLYTSYENANEKNSSIQPGFTPSSFPQIFRQSPEYLEMVQEVVELNKAEQNSLSPSYQSNEVQIRSESEYPTTTWTQFVTLTSRTWLSTVRDPSVMYVRTATATFIGLLVGLIFFNQVDDESSVTNRINSLLFFMCVYSLFCLPAISKIVEDRLLFTREHSGGYYRTSVYLLSNFCVELPVLFLLVISYSTLTYWLIGYEPDISHFSFFIGIAFCTINSMFSATHLLASVSNSTSMALALYLILMVYSLLLGGFIVSVNNLPDLISWAVKTSYFFFGFEALCVNEFENKEYGPEVLLQLGFQDANKYVDLYVLAGIAVGLRLVHYVSVRVLHSRKV